MHPFFGFLSDLVGRRQLYRLGTLVMLAWSFSFGALLDTKVQALMGSAGTTTHLTVARLREPQRGHRRRV